MWSFFLVILLLIMSNFNVTSQSQQTVLEPKSEFCCTNASKLIFGIVLFRHGIRNINNFNYPNDPYKDEIHWPEGFGQLTNEGKQQIYELGQFFRRRYGELLGNKYSPNKVYVRSSDVDRTLMSALACLAALFEPTDDEIWHKSINPIKWQPIPVHTVPIKLDYALWGPEDCPKFWTAHEKYQKESPEVQRIYTEYADEFAHWSEMCGKNLTTILDVFNLYHTLYIESIQNKILPDWAREAIKPNGTMEYITSFYFKMASGTKELARLQTGFLLKEIFELFAQKINSTLQPNRLLWLYSAHDYTVSSLLNSLGLFELHVPPFSASVHMELYEAGDKEHCIQIFYRKSNEENLTPMEILNYGQKCCTLERLYELYGDIIPGDHDEECGIQD
ncbi:prostatic acid phosphatase-like [Sitodiplosis mosellana]|uniref:prostatic acid phosphatase-like n=1 Tax=Sitodiplosis mosellana TaxID=263140 RepID=UPI002443C6E3|nr:prostatic acid phosphatase-like [Sitodiplosis mosellana]